MASISTRKNKNGEIISYRIRVSRGYDVKGNKLKPYDEKNHLKHRKLHSLRHTSATLLLYGGVNIKQVQERLGHGDITTTNKYLHYISEADEQAANVLQDMLITQKSKEKKQA